MVSLGMLTERPLSTAARRRGLPLMSPPPMRAETVISLMIFVQTFDFFESEASFLCLIFDHRLCPDMTPFLPYPRPVGRTPTTPLRHRRASRRPPARRRRARRHGPGARVIAGVIGQPVRALARGAGGGDVDPSAVAGHDRLGPGPRHAQADEL